MEENCYGRSARPKIKKTHQMTYSTQLYQTMSYQWIYDTVQIAWSYNDMYMTVTTLKHATKNLQVQTLCSL